MLFIAQQSLPSGSSLTIHVPPDRQGASDHSGCRARRPYAALMDTAWALEEMREFVGLTELVSPPASNSGVVFLGDDRYPSGGEQIPGKVQVVEQILGRVVPDWRTSVEDPEPKKQRWQHHRRACLQAIAQLERADELRERLGENAPTLDVSGLHPWVWEGARSLWASGHYREAVGAAARKLNAETQNTIGRRDVSEGDLFVQAYSDDAAAPGKSRLRAVDDDDGKTARSVRRGIRSYAEGCYALLRNPSSHDDLDELGEVEAIEHLAAFSILARLVASSSVRTADESTDKTP